MHPNDPSNPEYNTPALAQPMAIARGNGAIVEVEQQRAIAETQAAMIIAKKFPRDIDQAIKNIAKACTRPALAEQAVYEYARGGTEITGPSIRLAEAIAQTWGNMQFGIREVSQGHGESTVEAFAWDIETNTRQVKAFQVPHKRYTRAGTKTLTDPRDIYELIANNGARRLRSCILGTIPGDVVETALKQCEETVLKSIDLSPEALDKVVQAFARYDVNVAMIEKKFQRKLNALTPRNGLALRRIFTALKDGMGEVDDYFDKALQTPKNTSNQQGGAPTMADPGATAEKKPAAARKKPEPKPEPEQQTQDQPKPAHDPQTGELTGQPAQQQAQTQPQQQATTTQPQQAAVNTDFDFGG